MGDDYAELEAFLARRGDAMLATAVLLAGGRAAGEDLLQAALEKVVRGWRQITGDPEGYVRRALYTLAVLVLRYWEQLSEAEAASVLGCSVGTVKSSASRGLTRLRELTSDWSSIPASTRNGA